MLVFFYIFFFSSRRRHTRCSRDWSSDVCSSDLQRLQLVVRTGDELEALGDQFNSMAAQLKESYAGLERKVEARTRELTQSLEQQTAMGDRKSTRLNSSHGYISYAVFCLKKKKQKQLDWPRIRQDTSRLPPGD